jgi:Na+-transporting NADH:ubiquinone oxidoreductase subunit A
VWEINYQDVAAIGELFTTGNVNHSRVISLAGVGVNAPTLMRVPVGGNVFDLTVGRIKHDDNYRLISGSALYGTNIDDDNKWMSRRHLQITCIPEGRESKLFSWLTTGFDLFSVKRIFMSHITKPKVYHFDTSMRGSPRSMVPVGSYESIMPLDIIMTPFLKYLIVKDTEMAEKLGALELLEEDLSLATYVSPSKADFAPILRDTLDSIRKEI